VDCRAVNSKCEDDFMLGERDALQAEKEEKTRL
jgi:hypothetical protein